MVKKEGMKSGERGRVMGSMCRCRSSGTVGVGKEGGSRKVCEAEELGNIQHDRVEQSIWM